MTRRSLEERRTQYLDIGAGIISEAFEGTGNDPALALSHIKLADVAERAEVTKGALYHIWDSQESFWQDLLDRLLEINATLATDYLDDLVARDSSELAGVPTMYDHADAVFNSMAVKPALFARIGMVSCLSDETVRRQFDTQYKDALDVYRHTLELAILSMDRRLKDGLAIEAILVAVDALLEGLCLHHRLDQERTPTVKLPDGSEATLYSVALEAIVIGYTEPVAAGDGGQVPVGVMADIATHLSEEAGVARFLEDDEAAVEYWTSRATPVSEPLEPAGEPLASTEGTLP